MQVDGRGISVENSRFVQVVRNRAHGNARSGITPELTSDSEVRGNCVAGNNVVATAGGFWSSPASRSVVHEWQRLQLFGGLAQQHGTARTVAAEPLDQRVTRTCPRHAEAVSDLLGILWQPLAGPAGAVELPQPGSLSSIRRRPAIADPLSGDVREAPPVAIFGQQMKRCDVHLAPEFLM